MADAGWETYVRNKLVEDNPFLRMEPQQAALPPFSDARPLLPEPVWEGHDDAVACYWKAWELAFAHLRRPEPGSGFVSNFVDTAFNDCLFMWDSAFILLFARYGSRAFDFQGTLDNLYSHQHPDGFICREIREADGQDMFQRFDPASTGPNLLPWTEWEYFLNFGDQDRLAKVFPCLLAFYQWFRTYRTWPDGTYWSCGWGCGMDNQPRVEAAHGHPNFSHGHMAWIDTTLQQIFVGKQLVAMAEVLGRGGDVTDINREMRGLAEVVNTAMWDEATAFYYDRLRDGTRSDVASIGAYWALLAEVVPPQRLAAFVDHLSDPAKFNRPHRVPSLAADDAHYEAGGDYWLGSIWAPTNYMVLRGLQTAGEGDLAHEIALNHHHNVVEVFKETGTLWENYAPESAAPGSQSRPDFVGWSGLPPIAVLFEFIFGIAPDVPANRVVWDVRLLEAHGVRRYPFGATGLLDLHCAARGHATDEPVIEVRSSVPVKVVIRWPGDGGWNVVEVDADGDG